MISVVITIFFALTFMPRLFIFIYFFMFTGFYNFMPYEAIYPFSFENLIFLMNIAVILNIMICRPNCMFSSTYVNLYFFLFFYGVFWATISGHGSVSSALADGKDLLSVSIFLYAVSYNTLTNKYLQFLIYLSGLIISLQFMVSVVFLEVPIGGEFINETHPENGAHLRGATIIFFAYSIVVFNLKTRTGDFGSYLFGLLLLCTCILQPHRSIAVGALLITLYFVYTKYSHKYMSTTVTNLINVIPLLCFVGLGFLFWHTTIFNLISEVVNQSEAFGSRFVINATRWEYFLKSPIFGYGFIGVESSLGAIIEARSSSVFNRTLSVVDAGYIDILVRFGFFGLTMFFIGYARTTLKSVLKVNRPDFIMLIVTIALINGTWSVLTYNHGIIPLSILLAIYNSRSHA